MIRVCASAIRLTSPTVSTTKRSAAHTEEAAILSAHSESSRIRSCLFPAPIKVLCFEVWREGGIPPRFCRENKDSPSLPSADPGSVRQDGTPKGTPAWISSISLDLTDNQKRVLSTERDRFGSCRLKACGTLYGTPKPTACFCQMLKPTPSGFLRSRPTGLGSL